MSGGARAGNRQKSDDNDDAPRADAPVTDESSPSLAAVAETLGKEILRQAERRPYATVLVAASVGYVVAVATPNWAVKLAWTVGSRVLVTRLVAGLT